MRPFSSVASLLFINADQVKPEELRSAQDLLNPKWRGKISTEDPTTTGAGANMAARLYHQVGEDFVKSLYIDQKPVRTRERRQMSDWLARGTQPICLNCREDDVIGGKQGASFESRPGFCQLDSFQRRAGDLRARLRFGYPA